MASAPTEPVIDTNPDLDLQTRRAPSIQGTPVDLEDLHRPNKLERLTAQVEARAHVREHEEGDEDEDIIIRAGSQRIRIKQEDGVRLQTVDHTHPEQYRLYKPDGHAVYVPSTNWKNCVADGFLIDCPDCGTDCGRAPWGCAKSAEPRYMQCPERTCGKKFYDDGVSGHLGEDPNRIPHPSEDKIAESASMAKYVQHMIWCHPALAMAMGIMEARQ